MMRSRRLLLGVWLLLTLIGGGMGAFGQAPLPSGSPEVGRVFILPIRQEIDSPLVYLLRRGVKEAMQAKADLLVLDMETNGGRVDCTEQIMEILAQFKGRTVTYVNRKAYSAGVFISVSTQRIFMAPESVIGAAAPILMSPGGMGVESMPETVEVKMTSALSAKVRAYAEKNGHNTDVVEAMIDKQRELEIGGKVINKKGNILTLTNREAEQKLGDSGRPLLSEGTVESLDKLLEMLGAAKAERTVVQATGAERLAYLLTSLNWLWLILGVAGVYIEFKTPGFGLPGIVGICSFALYFLGGYVAGLSGLEWPLLFLAGLCLVALELFVFPGTIALGISGVVLMVVTLVMAMVDFYPGMPVIPSYPQLRVPLRDMGISLAGTVVLLLVLSRWLPKTPIYGQLVTLTVGGAVTEKATRALQGSRLGLEGITLSTLRPGGKAQFGEAILDVISQGEPLARGVRVRITGFSGSAAIVEPCGGVTSAG